MTTRRGVLQGLTGGFAGSILGAPLGDFEAAGLTSAARASEGRAIIAAASTLRYCLGDIAQVFAHAGGGRLRLTFGASGNLARQIRQGAPYALFLSADERFAEDLAADGFGRGVSAVYAVGRLALLARKGGAVSVDGRLQGLRQALQSGRLKRLAIANPMHAPYGMRAKEALQYAGVWRDVEGRLVYGENVAQAAQFIVSGAADAGLVAGSLARSRRIAPQVSSALIPADWHQPLRHRMLRLKECPDAARNMADAFHDFLQGPVARSILTRNGFSLPTA